MVDAKRLVVVDSGRGSSSLHHPAPVLQLLREDHLCGYVRRLTGQHLVIRVVQKGQSLGSVMERWVRHQTVVRTAITYGAGECWPETTARHSALFGGTC